MKNNLPNTIQKKTKALSLPEADEFDISNLEHFSYLSPTKRVVLKVMIENMCPDSVRTETKIAEIANVSRTTVWNCRQDPHFLACLSQYTKNLAKSKVPIYIEALEKVALNGNTKAIDLLIRYTGDYIPRSQVETKNQNFNISAIGTGDPIEEFVSLLSDKGMSLERMLDAVTQAYHALREQQRVM